MPRLPRPARQPVQPLEKDIADYFIDKMDGRKSLTVFLLQGQPEREHRLWKKYGPGILGKWIDANPCTRPRMWWKWDSPRSRELMAGTAWAGKIPEPRRRLGGKGVPKYEELAYVPQIVKGLPVSWIEPSDVRLWPRLAGKEVDPADPPTFESEAACLLRLGVLTPAERRHLQAHPELLEPEKIEFDMEDEKDGSE